MNYNKGFTLVELMITLAMSGIIVAAVYSAYIIQQKTYTAQDQVVGMQQNIRAAVFSMVQEFRMAGYDPTSDAGATITAATVSGFSFGQDIQDNGDVPPDGDGDLTDPNENITYGFNPADDNDNNGVVNNSNGVADLRRATNGGNLQPIAENIQAIEFLYTLENDTRTTSPTNSQFADIRSVTISILARAGRYDSKFINNTIYRQASAIQNPDTPAIPPGPAWDLGAGPGGATNDNYRRRLLITTVQCRNMGI